MGETAISLLYDARFRAIDANGAPYSGATLTVYTANTTTLAVTKTSSTLATPLTNPVVADSAGRFPQIFLAEGTVVDLLLKTSGGVLITSEEDVVALGTDTGVFLRDFVNSRLRMAGSGGVVRIEAGDASGDDVGGQLTLGGYSGTQADAIIFDGAATSTTGTFNSLGLITEASKKLDGVVLAEGTFSAAATVDIALAAAYRVFSVEFIDVIASSISAVPGIRLAFDNVPNFKTTGDYGYVFALQGGTSTAANNGTSFRMATTFNTASNKPGMFAFRLVAPVAAGTNSTQIRGTLESLDGSGTPVPQQFSFYGNQTGGYSRPTYLRLLDVTGGGYTYTGRYRVLGLRGFGE